MITKSGSTYSLSRYQVDENNSTSKIWEIQSIVLGAEVVGSLVIDREYTAVSFPDGKSLTTESGSEYRGKINIYNSLNLEETVSVIVGV